MFLRRLLYLCLVFLVLLGVESCKKKVSFEFVTQFEDSLVVTTSAGEYSFSFLSEDMVSVTYLKDSLPVPPSHAMVAKRQGTQVSVEEFPEKIVLSTNGIKVEITNDPFQINYTYKDQDLLSESGFNEDSDGIGFDFRITETEALYGGGERALGMNRRGNRLVLYNTPSYGYQDQRDLMYFSLPVVISSNRYTLLWDNPQRGFLDLGKADPSTLSVGSIGGRPSYTVVSGTDFYQMTANYHHLTGLQPLVPRWVLGNFSSRFGYHTQEETLETIQKFKEDSIPVDGVVIDIYWFGKDIKGHMGKLDWDREFWPEPEKMMKELREDGVKTVLITEPFILKTSDRWEEAVEKGVLCLNANGDPQVFEFYFGETGIIDVFNPKAVEWFWNIYKEHTNSGVSAWWGDLGEPEAHPDSIMHYGGKMAPEVHNIYGHYWAKLVHDGMKKDFPQMRPFNLMRAGFAGSQRYGMVAWSGDVSRSWGGLRPQPEMAIQMAMQGIGYFHSDLGGFTPGERDPELYTRWLQYGVFQPVFRPHANEDLAAEPVFWDEETKTRAREAIKMRYELLPFIYTKAYEYSTTGVPFLTPLFYEEPGNRELWDYDSAYLFGRDFLVAPVTQKGQKEKEVYLPGGSSWYNVEEGKLYEGGQKYTVKVKPEEIPLFIRRGAFIPILENGIQNTEEYSTQDLNILYIAGTENSTFTLFDDDGTTAGSIENGSYETIKFDAEINGHEILIRIESNGGSFPGKPETRSFSMMVVDDVEHEELYLNGNPIEYDDLIPSFTFDFSGEPVEIRIRRKE